LTNFIKTCPGSTNVDTGPFNEAPPSVFSELTDEYQEVGDGDSLYTYARSMKQELELRAGGKPYPGRKDLVMFGVSAYATGYGFNNDVNPPFFATNAGAVAASAIKLFGKSPDAENKVPELVVPSGIIPIAPLIAVQNKSVSVTASQAKLQILRAGKDIAWKKTDVWVGERLMVGLGWTANLVTVTNYEWAIPGDTVSSYITGVLKSELLEQIRLTNSETSFCWYRPAANLHVTCGIKATNVTQMTTKAIFNVRAPSVSVSATTPGSVAVDNRYDTGVLALHFGWGFQTNPPGIRFTQSANPPGGQFKWLQLIQSSIRVNICASGWGRKAGEGLDTMFPIQTEQSNGSFEDSPGTEIVAGDCRLERTDNFATFLMFKPNTSNSIWVALKQINWNWGGTAVWTNSSFSLLPGSSSFSVSSPFDQYGFPAWTNNFTNFPAGAE
jgi:hypothetical protein